MKNQLEELADANKAYHYVLQRLRDKEDELEYLIAEIEALQYILENYEFPKTKLMEQTCEN